MLGILWDMLGKKARKEGAIERMEIMPHPRGGEVMRSISAPQTLTSQF